MKYTLIIIFFLASTLVFAQNITPIANIQDSLSVYDGQTVIVQGVVTIGDDLLYSGKTQFYIQDDSGRGIQIFDHTPLTITYVRGDLIEVTGEIGLYTGSSSSYYNVQVNDPVVTLVSQGNELPDPYPVNGYEDFTMNGTWASANGEIIDIWDSTFGFYQITIDINGVEMDLQFWDSTGANVEVYIIGDVIIAHGIIAFYESVPQLSCAYEEDVDYSSVPEPDPDNDDYPYGDISERIPGEPVNITFTDTLGFTNVIMHWKTNRDINFNLLEMTITEADENIYEAEVPAQGEGTMVEFYIIASDTSGTEFIFPEEDTGLLSYSYNYKATSHIAVLNIPAKAFNPYSSESFHIEFGAEENDKAILRIYNAEGKLERTLFNDIIADQNGINQYDWDGRDKENNLLPLGLYICFLEVIDAENGNKQTAKAPIVNGAPLK